MLAEHGELNWWSQHAFAKAAKAAAARAASDPVNAERIAQATLDLQEAAAAATVGKRRQRQYWAISSICIIIVLAIGIVAAPPQPRHDPIYYADYWHNITRMLGTEPDDWNITVQHMRYLMGENEANSPTPLP